MGGRRGLVESVLNTGESDNNRQSIACGIGKTEAIISHVCACSSMTEFYFLSHIRSQLM